MNKIATLAPPNSVLLIMDPTEGIIPESMGQGIIGFTDSCVAVGTLSEFDGETQVQLSETRNRIPSMLKVFAGSVETPNNKLAVCTVLGDEVIRSSVLTKSTSLEVWVNDLTEPSVVSIVIAPG